MRWGDCAGGGAVAAAHLFCSVSLRVSFHFLFRLRSSSETSSSAPSEPKSPPLDGDQGSDASNRPHCFSVSPPLHGTPIFTSTQDVSRKSGSSHLTNHQGEDGVRSDPASTFLHHDVLTASESFNVASEKLKQTAETAKVLTHKTQKHPEEIGCVVFKIQKPKGTEEVIRSLQEDQGGGGDEGNNEEQGSGKEEQNRTETKSISAALSERMAAETSTDFHSRFLGFTFKPKKMMTTSMLKESAPHQDSTKVTMKRIQPVPEEEASSVPTNAKKRRVQTAEGAVSEEQTRRRKDSLEGRSSSSGRLFDVTLSGKDNRESGDDGRKKTDAEFLDLERGLANPVSASSDSGGQRKDSVAVSAFAKLSRFYFMGSTEHKAAQKSSASPERRDCMRADSVHPKEGIRRRMSDQNMEVDSEHQEKRGAVKSPGAVAPLNPSKRKCFQFRPTEICGPSPSPLTGPSLFESVDISDVLDTDWDQELSSLKTNP